MFQECGLALSSLQLRLWQPLPDSAFGLTEDSWRESRTRGMSAMMETEGWQASAPASRKSRRGYRHLLGPGAPWSSEDFMPGRGRLSWGSEGSARERRSEPDRMSAPLETQAPAVGPGLFLICGRRTP